METKAKNIKRKIIVISATLFIHLLLIFVLWQSVLKTPVSSWSLSIQKSDTLFLELNNINNVLKGDGFGYNVNTGGTSTALLNTTNAKGSALNQKNERYLSNAIESNNTSLTTDKYSINPNSLFNKINTNKNSEGNNEDASIKGDPTKKTVGSPNGTDDYGYIGLKGRTLIDIPELHYKSNTSGKIVVRIWVNKLGKVVKAIEGNGSTILSDELKNIAINVALKSVYNADPNANEHQEGRIIFNFKNTK
jgi:hypothetical protein